MAAPAFAATFAHTGNPTTAPSVTLGTTAANDILIATVANGGSTTVPTFGGTYSGGAWSPVDSGTWTTGAGATYWSRATGNHTGQTVAAATTDSGSLGVVRVTGALASGSPIDTNVSGASVAALNGTLAAFNTTVADTLVCLTVAYDDNIAWSAQTKNGVAMTERSEVTSSGGADSMVGFADLTQTAAGTTGSFAITQVGSGQGKRLTAFAIKPPVAATLERAAVVAGVGSLATQGTFWTTFERSSGASATGAVTVAGVRVHARSVVAQGTGVLAVVGRRDVLRSTSLAGAATVTTAGAAQAVHERAAAVGGSAVAAVTGRRDVLRAATVTGSGGVTTAATFHGTRDASCAVTATVALSVAGLHDVIRQAAVTGAGGLSAAGQIDGGATAHERQCTVVATSAASASAVFWTTLERASNVMGSTSLSAAGTLTVTTPDAVGATEGDGAASLPESAGDADGDESVGGQEDTPEAGDGVNGAEAGAGVSMCLESSGGVLALIE